MATRKVVFERGQLLDSKTRKRIGRLIESPTQNQVRVILYNGIETNAEYGTVDEKGMFYPFCNCDGNCIEKNGKCMLDNRSRKEAGYYVTIE